MAVGIHNSEMVDVLLADLQGRYEPNFAIANALSTMLALPQLRGAWLYSSVDNVNNVYDASGQGRTVGPGTAPTFTTLGLVPCAQYTRASSQFLARSDEAGLDITAGLTVLTWLQFAAGSTGVATGMVSKWVSASNDRSYVLHKTAGDAISFSASSAGTAGTVVAINDGAANYTTSNALFVAGRFVPATAIELFVSGTWYTQATANAGIYNGIAPLNLGRFDNANYLDGYMAFTALCASSLSNAIIRNFWEQTRAAFGV